MLPCQLIRLSVGEHFKDPAEAREVATFCILSTASQKSHDREIASSGCDGRSPGRWLWSDMTINEHHAELFTDLDASYCFGHTCGPPSSDLDWPSNSGGTPVPLISTVSPCVVKGCEVASISCFSLIFMNTPSCRLLVRRRLMKKNARATTTAKLAAATPTPIPALAPELISSDEEDDEVAVEIAARGEVVEVGGTRLEVEGVDNSSVAVGDVYGDEGGV